MKRVFCLFRRFWNSLKVESDWINDYELENAVIEFNNAFTEPLKETEVQAVLRCIPKAIDKFIAYEQGLRSGERKRVSKGMRDKEGYWYKNETLIDRLGITKSEQKHMKTIIGVDEKYDRKNEKRRNKRRNEEGLTKKQQELKLLQDKIKGVYIGELNYGFKGLTNKSISQKLSIPLKTLERHITKMRKNNVL
mgnify:CR=1 FL=1